MTGPSIYEVHAEGEGGSGIGTWTHAHGEVELSSMWTSTQKITAHALTSSCLLCYSCFKRVVYFMSTTCGRPEGAGPDLAWWRPRCHCGGILKSVDATSKMLQAPVGFIHSFISA